MWINLELITQDIAKEIMDCILESPDDIQIELNEMSDALYIDLISPEEYKYFGIKLYNDGEIEFTHKPQQFNFINLQRVLNHRNLLTVEEPTINYN